MTRAVLPTPATPSYCAAMTVGTMVKRFAHVRFLVNCLWVQLLFTLSVPRDIFRTPALIWGRFIDSGNQVGRTRSDIQAAGPRRCQSQIVLLLLGCKAGLILDDSRKFCPKERYRKDKQLKKLFAMPTSQSRLEKEVEDDDGLLDELVPEDDSHEYARSRKPEDLIAEASSAKHQFTHFPKNPYCRTCQRARMMAPHARRRGGQKRVETQEFGDHIIGDHVIIKKNVEEGFRGEQGALVLKDLHSQYRFVYPSQSKDAQSCVDALNHFIGSKDDVQVVYTDNSRN